MQKVQSFKTESGNFFVRSGNVAWYESKEGEFLRLGNDGEWDYAAENWGMNPMQRISTVSVLPIKGNKQRSWFQTSEGVITIEPNQTSDDVPLGASLCGYEDEWIYIVKKHERVVKIVSRFQQQDQVLYPVN